MEGHIINLHPALPGKFPGAHAIEDALHSEEKQTGCMVHTVVPKIDTGKIIYQSEVPILIDDTLESLKARIQIVEKSVLILAIIKQLSVISDQHHNVIRLIAKGKVRDIYDVGSDVLLMDATNRLSSFDQNLCEIPQKGCVLNALSAWWFKQTQHIVPNHLLHTESETGLSFVKKCKVFPIEFVVRGFITGSTNTSMWTLYDQGTREFGDTTVPDGYVKHQRLPFPILTPTSKSTIHDEPMCKELICDIFQLMTEPQYEECKRIALELFSFGQLVAQQKGLLLVDTKYEFGTDPITGDIILVDEIHTCDCSRFWDAATYEGRFEMGQEPIRFDKDVIREWVKERCDPYVAEPIPEIPLSLIDETSNKYIEFYRKLTGSFFMPGFPTNDIILLAARDNYFGCIHSPQIICFGDLSDTFTKKIRNSGAHLSIYREPFSSTISEIEYLIGIIRRKKLTTSDGIFIITPDYENMELVRTLICSSDTKYPVIQLKDYSTNEIKNILRLFKIN